MNHVVLEICEFERLMYFFERSGVDARANNNVFLERDAVIGIFSESLCIREFPGQNLFIGQDR